VDCREDRHNGCVSRLQPALVVLGALALVVLAPAAATTSRYGGTVVVALPYPDSMDPTVSQGSGVTIYRDECFRLYAVVSNHGNSVSVPLLAASMPIPSKDGLTYTVRLRQGVLFNDGTPMNAQAVVTSYQRFITYPGSVRAADFTSVADVTASGQYTVVFHMKSRDSSFTSNMYVFSPTALASEGANFAANPVCAGPFMFDHQDPGVDVTIVKSPYYWDKGDVHLDKIVFKPFATDAAAVAALESGDIQVDARLTPQELAAVQSDSALRVLRFTSMGYESIVINIGDKNGVGNLPYQNVRSQLASSPLLRQAFEEAIDRTTLVRVVEQGLATPTCTPIEPSNQPWFNLTKIPCTPFDPRDAKKLVAKSGIQNPTVHLLNAGDPTLAEFIQSEEGAAGIDVVIDQVADAVTMNALLKAGKFDAALTGFSGGPDPGSNVLDFFDTQGPRNYGGYSNPRMDYVLANGLKAMQPKDRAINYRVAEQIIETDRPAIYLYAPIMLTAVSTSVGGVFLNGGGQPLFESAQFK
jgi:peptide/nickel transport system substrate-binding protein